MRTKKSILTILVIYYFMFAIILYLGYNEKINLWLVPLQTIAGLAVFAAIFIVTQFIYSTRRIKSKLISIVFFDVLLFVLLFFLFVTISEWTNLSENVFGYISLVLSILISLVLGLFYYRKHKNYEIVEFLNKISHHTLLISAGFAMLFLISYLMSYKLDLLPSKEFEIFKGFGILVSLYVGIATCFWSFGSFLMLRTCKKHY